MSFLHWSEAYATGMGAYDAQHRALFAQVNELYGLVESFRPGMEPALASALSTFADLVRAHARTEEDLMAQAGHPCLGDHGAAHGAFLQRLEALSAGESFGPEAHPAILESLAKFRAHFEGEDEQDFILHLRNHGARPRP